jgi:hypothetical protein
MTDELKNMIDDESLGTLLRSNLSCYMGKVITMDVLSDISKQIVESVDYFINKKDEKEEV